MDRHAEGLDGFEAGAALGHVPARQFGVPVLGDAEEPDLAVLDGGDLGGVDRPHDVRRLGDDMTVMRCLAALTDAVRRQQGVLAHQAQDALAGDAGVVTHAQAGPDLPVSLAGPGGEVEILPDSGEQGLARDGRLRPTPRRRARLGAVRLRLAGGIEAGARHVPGPAYALDTVSLAAGGGSRLGHQRDLRRPKGPDRSTLARSSSFSMLSSPMHCMAAASWPSAGSA